MNENRFKTRLLYFFLTIKIITIISVFIAWDIGAITKKEIFGILSFVLPLFMAYIPVMFKNIYASPYEKEREKSERRVRKSFAFFTYFFMMGYTFVILYGIYLRISLSFNYEEIRTYFGFVETISGGYIGAIVFSLFAKRSSEISAG
jgi:cytochrome c biogenesis protein CcdA